MKVCSRCKTEKPLSDFQKRAANRDGFTGICKKCKQEYDNNHYASTPARRAYIVANTQTRIEAARRFVVEYLTDHPCVDCGETDLLVLEFDHRDREHKEYNVSLMIKRNSLDLMKKEIEKCDVRCANCHRRKTAKESNSWRLAHLA